MSGGGPPVLGAVERQHGDDAPTPGNATPQDTPHCFEDTRGRYRTASPAPGSARGAGAATEPPISVRRPGPKRGRTGRRGWTAVDARGTSRTHAAEFMRWGAGRTRKNRRTDTGGAARLEIAWHEPGTPGSYRRTLGDAQQREREPGAVAPNPLRSPVTPPGLSGTMGLPSPDAADTGAARRHPAGPARAATAQSTAALAPAPAPPAPPPLRPSLRT